MSGTNALPNRPVTEVAQAQPAPNSVADTIAAGASVPLGDIHFVHAFTGQGVPGLAFLNFGAEVGPATATEAAARVSGAASFGAGLNIAFVDATQPQSLLSGAASAGPFGYTAQPAVSMAGAAAFPGVVAQASGMLGDFSSGLAPGVAGGAMQSDPGNAAAGNAASGRHVSSDAGPGPIGLPFTLTS